MRHRFLSFAIGAVLTGGLVAASPVVAADPDAALLRARCATNAPAGAERETCRRIVDAYLAPAASAAPAPSLGAPGDAVTVTGKDDKNTDAFRLPGGDIAVTVDAVAEPGSNGCSAWIGLVDADSGDGQGMVQAHSGPEGTIHLETFLYGVPAGRYYWSPSFGCPSWTVTMTPVELPVESASDGPIVRAGAGIMATAPFELTGGDVLVTWTLEPNTEDCELDATLVRQGEGWGDSVEGAATGGTPASDSEQLYAVEPGVYHWSVEAMDFAWGEAPCAWTIAIEPA